MTNPTHIKLLKRVLKNTTPDILSDYFQYKGGLEDLDLKLLYKQEKKKEVYYQEIQRNLGNLGEVQKGQILNEFQKVDFFLNSNNDSFAYLLRFVQERTDFDVNSLDHLSSNYDKVFCILLRYNQEFYRCYAIRSLNEYNSRYWTARADYFDNSISLRADDLNLYLEVLKEQVQNTFKQELRGKHCQYRMLEFENKMYIFFDLQDYPQSIQTFNGENIEEKDLNPIFEIVFVIDGKTNVVNIYADSYDKRKELHQIIGSVIFKQEDVLPYCRDKDIFDPQIILDQLRKSKRFFIEIPHESSIKTIYINKLVLRSNTLENYSEITLDTKQTTTQKQYSDGRDMIYQMLSNQNDFHKNTKYTAKSVQFIAIVDDASPKLLRKKITINKQGLTNLGFEKIDEQIKHCFRQSGIMKIVD